MRLVILWFCLALWVSSPVVAQRQAIDSLYKIVHKLKQKSNYQQDTTYLNILHEIAYSYDSVKPDSMLIIAKQFKELAEKAKYEKGISRALQDIGVYYYGVGNYTKALEHLLEALRIAEKIQHLKSLASCYNNIALIYQVQNKSDKALAYHFKVLKIRDKTNDEARKATTFNNIGTIYSERKESERSLEYHYKALEINQKYNDLQGIAYNYNNIGFEYRILKKTDEAVQCLEKALKIVKEIGDEDMESEVYYNLAACELQRKNLPEALTLAQKSFEMGKKLHKILSIQGSHELLSKIYEAMGKFDLALEHHKLFKTHYDSIVNSENLNKANQLQTQYEYEKKEALLKEQQKEQLEDQQFYTYLAIAAVLITSLIILVLYTNQHKILSANKTISEQKAEIESQNAELEAQAEYLRDVNALKDRLLSIIGHDLKTPINQIKGILPILEMGGLTKEDFQYISGGITQNLTHASDLLDNLFRWALSQLGGETLKAQTFDLKALIDSNIELYAPIAEKKEILVTNVSLYKTLVWADIDMIDLVIRNLLSNSLKFCLPQSDIMFFVTEQENFVTVCVQDTGVGIAPEILPTLFGEGHESKRGTAGEKGTGLGLTLCRDFVTKNGGNIWVESTVGVGSKFYFTIPKDKNSPNL